MTEDVATLRASSQARGDFLAALATRYASTITNIARGMIGTVASEDFCAGEATQAFLSGAHQAIDLFREQDDGRGKNSLVGFCTYKGFNSVRDFIKLEFHTRARLPNQSKFERSVILAEDLYTRGRHLTDRADYAEKVVSSLTLEELLRELPPIDRSIVQLLVFGHDDYGSIRCASRWGSRSRCTADDIALTLSISPQYAYKRMGKIREIVREKMGVW